MCVSCREKRREDDEGGRPGRSCGEIDEEQKLRLLGGMVYIRDQMSMLEDDGIVASNNSLGHTGVREVQLEVSEKILGNYGAKIVR